jgi:YYY domain-containing protein
LLTPRQIADDQQSPPFGVQFPADSFSNAAPVFVWWLAVTLLGLITFPLVFLAFRALRDRGYIFSKAIGILLLAYLAWILASQHILAFSLLSLLLVLLFLLVCSLAFALWQRQTIATYLQEHWRLLLVEEALFTLAFLLFVGIRSLNPDLWNPIYGGEKPMELAFLNAVLRSPYMPPYDPWFSGGYINYYYYGYVVIGSLIKLTGIVPTTAFNLAIPLLFALTFGAAFSVVYSLSHRYWIALLGGYFAVVIGNLDGLLQVKDQVAAALAHMPVPIFDYWAASRVIPFTINEFPFWSFLFADLHPHVIDMPIEMLMLGVAATILLTYNMADGTLFERRVGNFSLYALAAFIFGTIACINPWDMPAYGLILATVLLLRVIYEKWGEPKVELLLSLAFRVVFIGLLCGLGYLLYWPFYASYQELYVNGLGAVTQGTSLSDYLTVFGLWLFIALTFFLAELYRWWTTSKAAQAWYGPEKWRIATYLSLSGIVLTVLALRGLKQLLLALMVAGIVLFVAFALRDLRTVSRLPGYPREVPLLYPKNTNEMQPDIVGVPLAGTLQPVRLFMYLLLLMGLGITLGQEVVYVRDFLDGGDYERMNTVFKFSMQAWLCFALGGALAVQQMWRNLGGIVRGIWAVSCVLLVVGSSIFLTEGVAARINDHAGWIAIQKPVQSAHYTPTVDGFAFANAWYPGDAKAIDWLNLHVAGSPVILEAAAPVSYQWYNRVSVYTGLPDVLGWLDHVGEQRYDYQPLNRLSDIVTIYTTQDTAQAVELLHYYHVRYIYVGLLERQLYGQQSTAGLDKFDHMVGGTLQIVYRADGVTIYEVT